MPTPTSVLTRSVIRRSKRAKSPEATQFKPSTNVQTFFIRLIPQHWLMNLCVHLLDILLSLSSRRRNFQIGKASRDGLLENSHSCHFVNNFLNQCSKHEQMLSGANSQLGICHLGESTFAICTNERLPN